MITREIIVKNKSGLHARPASIFVQMAKKFKSNISIKKGDREVNGKSMLAILSISVSPNDKIELIVEGLDEVDAVKSFQKLFNEILVD